MSVLLERLPLSGRQVTEQSFQTSSDNVFRHAGQPLNASRKGVIDASEVTLTLCGGPQITKNAIRQKYEACPEATDG
jgi:hypothetical protein